MSKFPLYDSLSKNIKDVDIGITKKKIFLKRIDKMDKNGHELIYALIRMYQIENNETSTSFSLPYDGIFVNKDISFDIDKLPNKLKQILFKFSGIHMKKMTEEQVIIKQTPVKRV